MGEVAWWSVVMVVDGGEVVRVVEGAGRRGARGAGVYRAALEQPRRAPPSSPPARVIFLSLYWLSEL